MPITKIAPNNVDDLLVGGSIEPPVQDDSVKPEHPERDEPASKSNESESDDNQHLDEEKSPVGDKKSPEKSESSHSDEIDEYGNEVEKPRTYTEEEVNKMMRDRVKRGNLNQDQQQQVKQASSEFKFDENSNEDWQAQLDRYIDHRLDTRELKITAKHHQEREAQASAEFEAKFATGMNKYKDFQDVMMDKPITDAMVMATRAMKDPAAFLYSAAKNHSKELEKISKIPDALAQAAEIGKLEERMRKSKNITRASKPVNSDAGDMTDKIQRNPRDIDHLIEKHARSRRR
jgi:polyhydroxyalkanoate synthesis regulator phasin